MNNALDSIAFLANSANRVAVLEALAERSHSRDGLMAQVDVSRVTLARILDDLEERTWIERTGREYVLTPLGTLVIEEFTSLRETMAAEQRLREVVQWLPSDLLTFDLRCLCSAEFFLLTETDMNALMWEIDKFHRSGEHSRAFAIQVTPPLVDTIWDVSVHKGTRLDWVVTPAFLDGIRIESTARQRFRETLDQDNVTFFLYEEIPFSAGIVDGRVGITLSDDQGVVRGGLISENQRVHQWAVDLFETYRDSGNVINPDMVTE